MRTGALIADDPQNDRQERDEKGRHKERNSLQQVRSGASHKNRIAHLGSPKHADEDEHGEAVLLLSFIHHGHKEDGEEDGHGDEERKHRPAGQPGGQRQPAERRPNLLRGGPFIVVALQPLLDRARVLAEEGLAEPSSFATAFDTDEVTPDRVAFPNNVLTEVRSKILPGQIVIASRNNVGVGTLHLGNVLLEDLPRLVLEWVRRVDVRTHILGLEFLVQDLVKLLEDLAEASLVQLRIRLELAELDVKADDALLEHDAGRVQPHGKDRLVAVVVVRRAVPARGAAKL